MIAVKDGRCYALELKAEGGKLTEAQEHVLIKLREAGATATHPRTGLDRRSASLRVGNLCPGAIVMTSPSFAAYERGETTM